MRFSQILAGLDKHPSFAIVARFATSIARRVSAGITYLYAHPTLGVASVSERNLALEPLRRSGLVAGDVLFRADLETSALLDEAQTLHADLVIVGSGARGGKPGLGRATRRLLRNLRVPAVIVPTHMPRSRPDNIDLVVAKVGGTPSGHDAFRVARSFVADLGLRVALVDAEKHESRSRRGLFGLFRSQSAEERLIANSDVPVMIMPGAWLKARAGMSIA